jgi:hypothetical protein
MWVHIQIEGNLSMEQGMGKKADASLKTFSGPANLPVASRGNSRASFYFTLQLRQARTGITKA